MQGTLAFGDPAPVQSAPTRKTTFDAPRGEALKEAGMNVAVANRATIFAMACAIAQNIARTNAARECSADDVMKELIKLGHKPAELGPATGSIFRAKCWEFTGKIIKSTRVSNHSATIRVWRLRAGA